MKSIKAFEGLLPAADAGRRTQRRRHAFAAAVLVSSLVGCGGGGGGTSTVGNAAIEGQNTGTVFENGVPVSGQAVLGTIQPTSVRLASFPSNYSVEVSMADFNDQFNPTQYRLANLIDNAGTRLVWAVRSPSNAQPFQCAAPCV